MPSTTLQPLPLHVGALTYPGAREVWDDAQARFYLEGISQSDYAQRVGGRLRAMLGLREELLDVGAGAGTMGPPLLAPDALWTAVEPSPFLSAHLRNQAARWPCRLNVLQTLWQYLDPYMVPVHGATLAANTCGTLDDTVTFWHRLRSLTRDVMVWVVPAQDGPHGICLSGFLPPDLHGEDMEPPVHGVLSRLGTRLRPDRIEYVDWTFRYRFSSREAAERYFQQRFNGDGDPERNRALSAHLHENLAPVLDGWMASAPKRSACLIWYLGGDVR